MKPATYAALNALPCLRSVSYEDMCRIVNIEYGQTEQSVIQLFQCVLRKYTAQVELERKFEERLSVL